MLFPTILSLLNIPWNTSAFLPTICLSLMLNFFPSRPMSNCCGHISIPEFTLEPHFTWILTIQSLFLTHILQLHIFLFFSYLCTIFLSAFPMHTMSVFNYPLVGLKDGRKIGCRKYRTPFFSGFGMCFRTYKNWYITSFGKSQHFKQSKAILEKHVSKGIRKLSS